MEAIKIIDLTKKYQDYIAVDHLNLEIKSGQLFSLLGVNGAGKTTTIKMISCLIKPTSGDALLLGTSINQDTQIIKQQINLSPQETAVASNLTVFENLEFIAMGYGQDKKLAHENVIKLAKQFGLESELKKYAKHLSGGMQRRLSIAMALITNPRILFLDEPTLGLDVIARRELWNIIRSLKGKITIVLTTHYLEEVEALADQVGIMVKGKLVKTGTVEQLLADTNTTKLEDAFIIYSGGQI